FTDVSRNFAENEIKALAAKGILTGYSDGSFQPKKEVSRAEFAIMLSRAFGYKDQNMVLIEKFKDLSVSAWYAPELSGALASGVTKGFTDE
ncbi:S-layer homology domain-containing protein, partial [Klebsiella pneumoniae]